MELERFWSYEVIDCESNRLISTGRRRDRNLIVSHHPSVNPLTKVKSEANVLPQSKEQTHKHMQTKNRDLLQRLTNDAHTQIPPHHGWDLQI